MTDVRARVEAMSTIVRLWPVEPSPASGFAADHALCSDAPTFDVVRHQLLTSLRRLRDAARLHEEDDGSGSHIFMLRPALVLVAKTAWILRPDQPEERVGRVLGMLVDDRKRGAQAMTKAADQGAIPEFRDLADKFERNANSLAKATTIRPIRPPADEPMILELGNDVDTYYASSDAKSDVQILWNASSSLAHGEVWFSELSGGRRPRRLAEVLTERSFAAVCSGLNVTSLRVASLATEMCGSTAV